MPEQRASWQRDASASVRDVLDLLLQDCSPKPVDAGALPWDRPIFVLRSAALTRLRALLSEIARHNPSPSLHIMSHARDAEAIGQMVPWRFTFHAYPTPGRYCVEAVPAAMLDELRAIDFGSLLFLDTAPDANFYDEVERLLGAVAADRSVIFREDGTFAKAPPAAARQLAEPAFFRLVEWHQRRVEDTAAGHDGPRECSPTRDCE